MGATMIEPSNPTPTSNTAPALPAPRHPNIAKWVERLTASGQHRDARTWTLLGNAMFDALITEGFTNISPRETRGSFVKSNSGPNTPCVAIQRFDSDHRPAKIVVSYPYDYRRRDGVYKVKYSGGEPVVEHLNAVTARIAKKMREEVTAHETATRAARERHESQARAASDNRKKRAEELGTLLPLPNGISAQRAESGAYSMSVNIGGLTADEAKLVLTAAKAAYALREQRRQAQTPAQGATS
jgi:hypothetical protein